MSYLDGKTHFADDATLAYIHELEQKLEAASITELAAGNKGVAEFVANLEARLEAAEARAAMLTTAMHDISEELHSGDAPDYAARILTQGKPSDWLAKHDDQGRLVALTWSADRQE